MRRRSRSCLFALPVCVALLGAGAAGAQPALTCDLPAQPGASLLLPYFEVDLANVDGRTTMFAVGNAAESYVLARATVWTNWGNPVAAFDFFVEGGALRSFNVRALLLGVLPTTSPPADRPAGLWAACATTLTPPVLGVSSLLAVLTGEPSPDDGLCHGAAVAAGLATGYITVDVVNDCTSDTTVTPLTEGYFGDCGSGLAGNENVLWGDFFLLDPGSDHAKGERMVTLTADQGRFGTAAECVDPPCGFRNDTSFYDARGNRMPLPAAYETRFLTGGGFDGGTELLVWVHGRIPPTDCALAPMPPGAPRVVLASRSERGVVLGSTEISALHSQRLRVGGEELPLGNAFGRLEISASDASGSLPQQLWVMPLLSADGRYSVGFGAVPVDDFCEP